MDEVTFDLSVTVEELRAAGSDISKQLQALLKLGNCYLKKAKTAANGDDFTKADALFNAALVRSKLVNHEISGEILRKIVETYREFLLSLPNVVVEICANDIRHEIDSHKEFLANERRIFKECLDEIDSCFNTTDKTEDEYKIHAAKIDDVFRDIQDMYNRLVSMLAKECESRLGPPPCDYAIIALGSVARMEATPFSDLEFGILYSDPAIGDKISYFRVLTYFLHLKVINLGETTLPVLGIEQLNDFQSSDPNSIWFYDSVTPRGISFDGAMPWACKTPLGRMETEDKPALELIRTPEQMAELQDEGIAVKEGYHLADIMSRAALLHGDQALLDEYNERVAEKLNATSSSTENKSTRTVGFMRGIQQMVADIAEYVPNDSYFGSHTSMGALFDAKRQFYRLISLLLSDLGLIFDIRCPSPRQIVQELQTRGIIGEAQSASIKVCLSIANEMRLKTYYGYNKQTELLSPVPRKENETEESADLPIFRFFDEDVLIRLLSVSNDMHERCYKFYLTYVQQDKIDTSVFANPFVPSSNASLIGCLYLRLHNLPKALEWMELESEDSPEYTNVLHRKGVVYLEIGEYNKSVDCCVKALDAYKNEELSILNEVVCSVNLATALIRLGQYHTARKYLEEGISKHNEIFGEDCETVMLGSFDAYSRRS